jgi:hypothetical protein
MTRMRDIANIVRNPSDGVPPSLQQLFVELAIHYRNNTSVVAVHVRYEQNNADIFSFISIKFVHDTRRDHRDPPEIFKQRTRELFEKLFAQLNRCEPQHRTMSPPTRGVFRWDIRRSRLENVQSIRLLRRRPQFIFYPPTCGRFNGPMPQSLLSHLRALGLLYAQEEDGQSSQPNPCPGD